MFFYHLLCLRTNKAIAITHSIPSLDNYRRFQHWMTCHVELSRLQGHQGGCRILVPFTRPGTICACVAASQQIGQADIVKLIQCSHRGLRHPILHTKQPKRYICQVHKASISIIPFPTSYLACADHQQ